MENNQVAQPLDPHFLQSVSDILDNTRKNTKTAVNLAMVYAYYEIGRMIVEEEQHGKNRAEYGKYLLQSLATYLKQMRQFFLVYDHDATSQTLSDRFDNLPTVGSGRRFFLSRSHYLKLLQEQMAADSGGYNK